jgi:hypothetical protein
MEYLLDVQWADPVATAVRRVLSGLPAGVESRTAVVPTVRHHGFTLLSLDDPTALASITDAITAAGADVRIVASEAA